MTIKYLTESATNNDQMGHALWCGAKYGNLFIVKLAIKYGVSMPIYGYSALQLAAENDHLNIAKCLIDNDVDLSYAFVLKTKIRNTNTVKYLIKQGADIDYEGSSSNNSDVPPPAYSE